MLVLLVVLVTGITAQATEAMPSKVLSSQLDFQEMLATSNSEDINSQFQNTPIDHCAQGHPVSERELIELVITEEDDNEESNQKLRKGTEEALCNPFALTNGISFADNRIEFISADLTFVHTIQVKRFVLISVFRI